MATEGEHPHIDERLIVNVIKRTRPLLLLMALLAYIILMPILNSPIAKAVLMLGIIAGCLGIATVNRHQLFRTLPVALPAAILIVVDIFRSDKILEWIAYGFLLLFFLEIIRLMLHQIFSARQVTIETISLGLCTYVLMGILWVLFYIPLVTIDPDALVLGNLPPGGDLESQLIYFSYVTLTTLGYGDIAPVSPLAQGLAITEALAGTLFLAVLIGRLVGAYSAKPRV